MIRHSSSLFLSFLFHIILFFILFFTYKKFFDTPKPKEELLEKRVCIDLCHVSEQKVEPSVPAPIEKPKLQKKEPKPKKIVKKEAIKKREVKKEIPIKKDDLIKEEQDKEVEVDKEIEETATKVQEQVDVIETAEAVEIAEVPVNMQEVYIDENIQKIRELISENLYYPRRARKKGIVGEVMVSFHLSTKAKVSEISVLSSHSDILSRAAIKTIENLSNELPKPKEDLILHVPIVFKLSR